MSRAAIERLNGLPEAEARAAFLRCCGASQWAARMATRRPFTDEQALFAAAAEEWAAMTEAEYLEAFSHHPRIGERASAPAHAVTASWSGKEQSGMRSASDAVRAEFARLNDEYEARLGFVFLICATGKSAEEMLGHLRIRLGNERAVEIENAAAEQALITRLRLGTLLAE